MVRIVKWLLRLRVPVLSIALLAAVSGLGYIGILFAVRERENLSVAVGALVVTSVATSLAEARMVRLTTNATRLNLERGIEWLSSKLRTNASEMRETLRICTQLITLTDVAVHALFAIFSGLALVLASALIIFLHSSTTLLVGCLGGCALIMGAAFALWARHKRNVEALTPVEQRLIESIFRLEERRPTIQVFCASRSVAGTVRQVLSDWHSRRESYSSVVAFRKSIAETASSVASLIAFAIVARDPSSSKTIADMLSVTIMLSGVGRAVGGAGAFLTHSKYMREIRNSGVLSPEGSPEAVIMKNFSEPPVFELCDVGVKAGENAILRDINLCVRAGEKIALVGKSGAGKSTLLRVLAGLAPLSSGCVRINGDSLGANEVVACGAMLQNDVLLAGSIGEELELAARRKLARSEVRDIVNSVGLGVRLPDAGSSIKEEELSAGELQRVSMARMLAASQVLWLLDEPNAHLDPKSEDLFLELLVKSTATVVMVAHSLRCVFLADSVVVLENGMVTEIGVPRDLIADSASRFSAVFG